MKPAMLPGERALFSQAANLLLGGLSLEAGAPPAGRFDALVSTARGLASMWKGSAIGGTLTLTNDRFYFASHGMNWTTGSYSLFVPTVVRAHAIIGLISDQLTIETKTGVHEFVVRNAKTFLGALDDARADAKPVEALQAKVRANLDKIGDGIETLWDGTSVDDAVFETLRQTHERAPGSAIRVLGALTTLDLMLLD